MPLRRTPGPALLLALLALGAPCAEAADSSRAQAAIARSIDTEAPAAVDLLGRLIEQNSGTFNLGGVRAVGDLLAAEFQALGFETRFVSMDAVERAPHLVAVHRGRGSARGHRLLLIGHMDTVFEPFSPFKHFVRSGDTATGPGANDMKGGLVVMLSALKALRANGLLDGGTITVFITADEEMTGRPFAISRGAFIDAGKNADATLCFESGVSRDGVDYASTARRGFTGWRIDTTARTAHSSAIFSDGIGDGAVYEISRILSRFHAELREPNLTYNVGLLLGGGNIKVAAEGVGSVAGKTNIVPPEARAEGEFRALTPEQVARVQDRMRGIVAASLPGAQSTITFEEGYPPMAPTPGNAVLLAKYSDASRALGLGEVQTLDPMLRGAGDSAFVSPYVDTITGLGAVGSGSHTPNESVDLKRLPVQAKRAALLIHRLLHSSPARRKSAR